MDELEEIVRKLKEISERKTESKSEEKEQDGKEKERGTEELKKDEGIVGEEKEEKDKSMHGGELIEAETDALFFEPTQRIAPVIATTPTQEAEPVEDLESELTGVSVRSDEEQEQEAGEIYQTRYEEGESDRMYSAETIVSELTHMSMNEIANLPRFHEIRPEDFTVPELHNQGEARVGIEGYVAKPERFEPEHRMPFERESVWKKYREKKPGAMR